VTIQATGSVVEEVLDGLMTLILCASSQVCSCQGLVLYQYYGEHVHAAHALLSHACSVSCPCEPEGKSVCIVGAQVHPTNKMRQEKKKLKRYVPFVCCIHWMPQNSEC
jgi:hypothetical protein